MLERITVLAEAILRYWQHTLKLTAVSTLAPPGLTIWLVIVFLTTQPAFAAACFQVAILAEGAVATVCVGIVQASSLVV